MKKVLIVAAHPDDEVLGVGGTAAKLARGRNEVYALILGEGITSRFNDRDSADVSSLRRLRKAARDAAKIIGYKKVIFEKFPDNRFDSVDLLEIIKLVEAHIKRIRPGIVYTHHRGDLNIDHELTFRAVNTACRPAGDYDVKELYSFETNSSTEWNFGQPEVFRPNVFINVESTMEKKLKALSCYEGELRKFPHPRSLEAIKLNSQRWGSVCGVNHAEAFELVRKVDG